MKNKALIISASLFLSILPLIFYSQKYEGELSEIEYNIPIKKSDHLYQIIETKQRFLEFMEIKKGETVAEIGSEDGVFISVISTLYDSVTFYAQDINTKVLSKKNFDNTLNSYSKYKNGKETNKYEITIGTETESKLPDNTFDKIFIMTAFHDFDKKEEMLIDIYSKLNSTGQLIIEDGFSYTNDTLICKEFGYHQYMIMDSLVKMCERHQLYLTKMRNPNFHASNYANILVFEKNQKKSEDFLKQKKSIDEIVKQSFLLNKNEVASDSVKVKEIETKILPYIKEISSIYPEYDIWVKELALKYLRKSMYQSAINILKTNINFYPYLYQSYYWLGVTYQENKQFNLASKYLQRSLAFKPNNTEATKRLALIKKHIKS